MRNPWKTGESFFGLRLAYCDAQGRINAAKHMRADRLRACLAWPDTQKNVRQFIERCLRKIRKNKNESN